MWRDLQIIAADSVVYYGLSRYYGVDKKPKHVLRITGHLYKQVTMKTTFCGSSQKVIGAAVILAFMREEGKGDPFFKENFRGLWLELDISPVEIIDKMMV